MAQKSGQCASPLLTVVDWWSIDGTSDVTVGCSKLTLLVMVICWRGSGCAVVSRCLKWYLPASSPSLRTLCGMVACQLTASWMLMSALSYIGCGVPFSSSTACLLERTSSPSSQSLTYLFTTSAHQFNNLFACKPGLPGFLLVSCNMIIVTGCHSDVRYLLNLILYLSTDVLYFQAPAPVACLYKCHLLTWQVSS